MCEQQVFCGPVPVPRQDVESEIYEHLYGAPPSRERRGPRKRRPVLGSFSYEAREEPGPSAPPNGDSGRVRHSRTWAERLTDLAALAAGVVVHVGEAAGKAGRGAAERVREPASSAPPRELAPVALHRARRGGQALLVAVGSTARAAAATARRHRGIALALAAGLAGLLLALLASGGERSTPAGGRVTAPKRALPAAASPATAPRPHRSRHVATSTSTAEVPAAPATTTATQPLPKPRRFTQRRAVHRRQQATLPTRPRRQPAPVRRPASTTPTTTVTTPPTATSPTTPPSTDTMSGGQTAP